MKYILLNFAYGFGPFLRTCELAVAVNEALEKKGKDRCGIIVPLVYGERQIQIMREEFSQIIQKSPHEILLDSTLGSLLSSIYYGTHPYVVSLQRYLESQHTIEHQIQSYLKSGLTVRTFANEMRTVRRDDICGEINRAPRVSCGITPSFAASFAYISEILETAGRELSHFFDKNLLLQVSERIEKIERQQSLRFIAEPSTFSYRKTQPKHPDTIFTPPNAKIIPPPTENMGSQQPIAPGIFVTVTGIPGLDKLFTQAREIGLAVYSNNTKAVPGSISAPPHIVWDHNILLHFARSGWGSVWLSEFALTPFITPEYASDDDPEIYYNNECIEGLTIGKIYHGQSLQELLSFTETYTKSAKTLNNALFAKYGTLDGVTYTAQKIVEQLMV